MRQIPFLALSAPEQEAVLRSLQAAGVALRGVCVSRIELALGAAGERTACTTVSTPRWAHTWPDDKEAGHWVEGLAVRLAGGPASLA